MKEAYWPSQFGAVSQTPEKIIVHAMAEFIDQPTVDYFAPDWLAKCGLSAHILVTPSGVPIRCRQDNAGAFHAKGHNTNSLGIEILVPGVHTYHSFSQAIADHWVGIPQWETSVDIIKGWMDLWSIPGDKIYRHSDLDPDRKIDPGEGFPWHDFKMALDGIPF